MKKLVSVLIILVLMSQMFLMVAAESVSKNEKAMIDWTDVNKTGTIKAQSLIKTDKRLKIKIEKDGKNYTYDLKNDGTMETYPLQLGDGIYKVKFMTNTEGAKYAVTLVADVTLKLEDPNAPYTNSSQYVNYTKDSKAIQKANEIVQGCTTELEKVQKIYAYVIESLVYDTQKANDVKDGKITTYLPDIDNIISTGKGICFDYAAVFAAMLRSQGIPAKLVTGYVSPSNAYHAWNEFFLKGVGWFKINEMNFNGNEYERVDPTFDSTSKSNKEIIKFIGNGDNYSKLYEY